MAILTIDGYVLRKAIMQGSNELQKHKDYVDSLNVFPVPDGDTGINMSLTVLAAAREVAKLNTPNVYEVAKAASSGALRGARGNSGVILSQLFRGFAKGLEGKEVATAEDIAEAFLKGSQTAYKAVMKPKEGTILTVAKSFGEYCVESAYDTDDIEVMLKEGIEYGLRVLDKTTEMLEELKRANVVDSGGMGLMYIIQGAFASRNMDVVEIDDPVESKSIGQTVDTGITDGAEIKFGYCTEFFINVTKTTEEMEENLKKYLNSLGDSIVVVGDEDIIKVHVHTNNPGKVIERALTLGALTNMKIDNMRYQHSNIISFAQTNGKEKPQEIQEMAESKTDAFITVAAGSGLSDMFKELGVDVVIEGGQSMNPSTEDILSAIEKINAENIFIMPNNKNIILAAEQAAVLSEKNIYVVPTTTIPQGVSAIVSFVQGMNPEDNMENMAEAIKSVNTAMVTFAVRDSSYENLDIKDGDKLGIIEGKIDVVAPEVTDVSKALIDKLMAQCEGEILSIYYGEDITEDDANELVQYVEEKYPDCESVVMNGGQPLYYYIISLE